MTPDISSGVGAPLTGVRLEEFSGVAELLTKTAVAFAGVSYVMGLLVINLYLRQFGIYSPGVVRVEYVMAGALWVVLAAFGYFLYAITLQGWRRAEELWKSRPVWAIVNLTGGLLLAFAFGTYTIAYLRYQSLAAPSRTDLEIVMIVFVTPLATLGLRDFSKRAWSVAHGEEKKWQTPLWGEVMRLGIFVWALSWYSTSAYAQFPPMFGGGRPAVVIVLVKSEAMPVFGSAPVQPTAFLRNYDLILDTPEWLALAPRTATTVTDRKRLAIRIRRDDVIAIISRDDSPP